MNVGEMVLAAASHGVHAEEHVDYEGPVPGSVLTVVRFPGADQAETFADACADERIPARQYGAVVLLPH